MVIMQFLKDKNLFIKICKFQSFKETYIGFLSGHHPSSTLKSDLREDIDRYLQEVNLTSGELTTLTHESDKDEIGME